MADVHQIACPKNGLTHGMITGYVSITGYVAINGMIPGVGHNLVGLCGLGVPAAAVAVRG
jgi:hypothetical protein